MTEVKNDDLTRDAFLDGRVHLLQPVHGYRAGIDAVLLAATAQPQDGRATLKILDAGAGVGTVGLLAAFRLNKLVDVHVTMVERAPELAKLAARNVRENGLTDAAKVVCADLLGAAADLEALGLQRESFDLVMCNPPYHVDARGTPSRNVVKAGAHAMGEGELEHWARALAHFARPGGEVIFVHKAEALGELLAALRPRFGALVILPLHPREGLPASRLLVSGMKGSRAPLTVLPGVPLHVDGHAFHPIVSQILREGMGLSLRMPATTSRGKPSEQD